jgi:hypothetical protein
MTDQRKEPADGLQGSRPVIATPDDVRAIFGTIEDDLVLQVLDLHPTIGELEEASVWLSGDRDVFEGRALGRVAGAVATLMEPEDEP